MIKIAVDGRPFQDKLTGVGKYVIYLLRYLENKYINVEFIIISNKPIMIDLPLKCYKIIYDNSILMKVKPMIWYILLSHRLVRKEKIDYFFAGASFCPFFLKKIHIITLIHDLNHLLVPETMSKLHYLTHLLFFRISLNKSGTIWTNSQGTANKLKKYYDVQVDEIINPFVDPEKYKIFDKKAVDLILSKYEIKSPYLLSVGTLEPRKNIDKIIQVFLELKKENLLPIHKLVLIGTNGWKNENVQGIIKENSVHIIQLGYVDESDLPFLYNGTDLFLFPSMYEGFGIPAREAIYCGAQCIVTDTEELREATFNKSNYIDTRNINALKMAIIEEIKKTKVQ